MSHAANAIRRLTPLVVLALTAFSRGADLPPATFPPIEAFFDHPRVGKPTLSPDGRSLVYATLEKEDDFILTVADLDKQSAANYKINGKSTVPVLWLSNSRVVLLSEFEGYSVFDLEKKRSERFNPHEWVRVIHRRGDDPNLLTVQFFPDYGSVNTGFAVINVRRPPVSGVGVSRYRYNVTEWISMPEDFISGWVDHHGQVRGVTTYHDKQLRARYRPREADKWTDLSIDAWNDTFLEFHSDPNKIYLAHRPEGRPTAGIFVYNVPAQAFTEEIASDPVYSMDAAEVIRSRKDGSLVGFTIDKDAVTTKWLSATYQEVQRIVDHALPGKINRLLETDDAERLFVVSSYSDRDPVRYFIYDSVKKQLRTQPQAYPLIKPERMSAMQVLSYETRDGLRLKGYLTLPPNTPDGAKPPLVVLPHGGPWVRDTWGFDPEAQFLASRGYAVFQPNYRGSTGFAKPVSKDPEFDFKAMHNDVTDGVKKIIETGLVDPRRVAIMGASFGGYLALCGAAFEPDLYRCAITTIGVFDWEKLVRQKRGSGRGTTDYVYDHLVEGLGRPAEDKAKFEAISPLRHTDDIKIPIFVSHGEDDANVDVSQSKQLVALLKKHGTPVESFFAPEEGHGYFRVKNRVRLFREIEVFLAKYL